MIVIKLKPHIAVKQISGIINLIEKSGYIPNISKSDGVTHIGVIGDEQAILKLPFRRLGGIAALSRTTKPFKLTGREYKSADTQVKAGHTVLGGRKVVVMAGPCAVESYPQVLGIARAVKKAGATVLRGGAFKPRTSPYSFQGLKEEGLKILAAVRQQTGLPVVTEVISSSGVGLVSRYADILQIGARNMQNYALLEEVGKTRKPVLLKRGMMSTLEELLMSAEYILAQGNPNVILCERGIRTFEKYTRNTLDISAVPLLKQMTHLPVIVDPSHATGIRSLVAAVSKASIAAGADGLIIEVHTNPDKALSDGFQSITPIEFSRLMTDLSKIAHAVNRTI
ncbi:MAG: 3-deoxy-7-phosphoheptulonate synthase [Planctomycetes bacterium]|nr:3-deoxy-7-phosphoheptulonate synthase [Planctomycetota bacterium]